MSDAGPDLPLDWEERLFARLHRWWRGRRRGAERAPAGAVELADHLADLQLLAQLFAGRSLDLRGAEANGGVRGRLLLLPTTLAAGPDADANLELYRLRAVISGTRVRLGSAPPSGDALLDDVRALAEAARAIRTLKADFAGFERRLEAVRGWLVEGRPEAGLSAQGRALEALRRATLEGAEVAAPEVEVARLRALDARGEPSPPVPLWGGALGPADEALAQEIAADEAPAGAGSIRSEHEAPPRDHVERVFQGPDEDAEVMPVHTFEKVECLEGFNGNMRRTDGSDELEDHQEALDEVDLRHILRGGEPVESVYRADVDGLGVIPDVDHVVPGEQGIRYDEWDQRAGRYRRGWTTVYPGLARAGDEAWASARLETLGPTRRRLLQRVEAARQARAWTGRQRDGDEVDLDALIESYGDRRAGRPGALRLYRRNPRRRRDLATTVLIDVSLSSDAWVEDRRVLDVSRDAVLLLGEVADALGDRLEVLAFASNTRNRCRVWQVKGWRDAWAVGRQRLGALAPTGYTRIGPALRHATAELAKVSAERKLLLVVTDGKPNDYDRYEGAHGVADVRHAVREAVQRGVTVRAIGMDPTMARALPVMFGVGNSQGVRHLSELVEALVEAYGCATCD